MGTYLAISGRYTAHQHIANVENPLLTPDVADPSIRRARTVNGMAEVPIGHWAVKMPSSDYCLIVEPSVFAVTYTSAEQSDLWGEVSRLQSDNAELRAYLKAFCGATIIPEDRGRDVGAHEANPTMEWIFTIPPEGMRSPRIITGGQIRRAMELVGYGTLKISPAAQTIAEELSDARANRDAVRSIANAISSANTPREAIEAVKSALDGARPDAYVPDGGISGRTAHHAALVELAAQRLKGDGRDGLADGCLKAASYLRSGVAHTTTGQETVATPRDGGVREALADAICDGFTNGNIAYFDEPDSRRIAYQMAADAVMQRGLFAPGSAGPGKWPASHQETFSAIAAATSQHGGGTIRISVKEFYRALAYPDAATPSPAQEPRTGDTGERFREAQDLIHHVDAILCRPPEPVSFPNEAWCETYAEWHDAYAHARSRVLASHPTTGQETGATPRDGGVSEALSGAVMGLLRRTAARGPNEPQAHLFPDEARQILAALSAPGSAGPGETPDAIKAATIREAYWIGMEVAFEEAKRVVWGNPSIGEAHCVLENRLDGARRQVVALATPSPAQEPGAGDTLRVYAKLEGDSLDAICEVIGSPALYSKGKSAMRDWFLGRLRRHWNIPAPSEVSSEKPPGQP